MPTVDYFGAGILPKGGIHAIQAIRRKYDPTASVIAPHVAVLFPIPVTVGETELFCHLERICEQRSPFPIRLGGLQRADDHWLLLTLMQGAAEVRSLYRAVYSGLLGHLWRDDITFVPHVGLGLFVRGDSPYTMGRPDSAQFDDASYHSALAEAAGLEFPEPELADELVVMKLPGTVMEWAAGLRRSIPSNARAVHLRTLRFTGSAA